MDNDLATPKSPSPNSAPSMAKMEHPALQVPPIDDEIAVDKSTNSSGDIELPLDQEDEPPKSPTQPPTAVALQEAIRTIKGLTAAVLAGVNLRPELDTLRAALSEGRPGPPTLGPRRPDPRTWGPQRPGPPLMRRSAYSISQSGTDVDSESSSLSGSDHSTKGLAYVHDGVMKLPMDELGKDGSSKRHLLFRGKERVYIIAYYHKLPDRPAVSDLKEVPVARNTVERPQRVHIVSDQLVDELESISGITLRGQLPVLIPPFKFLVYNWSKIQATLSTLEDELQQRNTSLRDDFDIIESEAAVDFTSGKEVGPTHSRRTLTMAYKQLERRVSKLRALSKFVKTDLTHLVSLRSQVKQASIENIFFEDAYYLFKPGDLVLSAQTGDEQLYQVFSVTGGRQRLSRGDNSARYRPGVEDSFDDSFGQSATGIGTWTNLRVQTFSLLLNGRSIQPLSTTHRIPPFPGERKITELPVFPVQFCEGGGMDICKRLEQRGYKYLLCNGHKKYAGSLMMPLLSSIEDDGEVWRSHPPLPPSQRQDNEEKARLQNQEQMAAGREIRADIYVDLNAYFHDLANIGSYSHRLNLRRAPVNVREMRESFYGRSEAEYNFGDREMDEQLTENFLQDNRNQIHPLSPQDLMQTPEALRLLPQQIPAYDFRSRRWVWIDSAKIEEVDKSQEARDSGWQDLVIPENYRSLLVSLVDYHVSNPDALLSESNAKSGPSGQIDLVRGKGRGLIILLHGPPGTGKTSTAETIAAYTGRPLYAITCGDLGVRADEVAKRLRYHSNLAEAWNCVLLLDEADVFLMKRTWDDMQRNAVVSVFLRQLEYYTGILFLTTNIVGVIDEAFKSRIHVALQYPDIDLHSTETMWNNLLDRIQRNNVDAAVKTEFNREMLLDFARAHYNAHRESQTTWNGRQLRNAFQTAMAMGQFERLSRVKDEGLTAEEAAAGKGDRRLRTVRLTRRNFEKISRTAREFEDYITATRGVDSQVAQASQLRDDDFGKTVMRAKKRYGGGGAGSGSGPGGQGRAMMLVTPPQPGRPRKGKEAARQVGYEYEENFDEEVNEPGPDDEEDEDEGE